MIIETNLNYKMYSLVNCEGTRKIRYPKIIFLYYHILSWLIPYIWTKNNLGFKKDIVWNLVPVIISENIFLLGNFPLLLDQVQAPEIQQRVHISRLGLRDWMDDGNVLDGLHPSGHCNPDLENRRNLHGGNFSFLQH